MSVPPAVRAFRARFRGLAEAGAPARDAGANLRECLLLHDLAVQQDLERAARDLGGGDRAAILALVNRRRLESSPMPMPLRERLRSVRPQ